MASLPYKLFTQRHPTYDSAYWRRCRALYAGGKKLLGDTELLREIFPPHNAEDKDVYKERCKRAYYIPYAGEILDAIVANLTSTPVTVTSDPEASDPYYKDFVEDVTPAGEAKLTLNQLARDQVLTALQVKTAWTLVDLPPEGEIFPNLAAQDAAGARDPYAVAIDPEDVLDWEEDAIGDLEWVLVRAKTSKRRGLEGDRDRIREAFTYYTRTEWVRYAIEYDHDKPPQDKDEVAEEGRGGHSFGQVPIVRLTLPDGLWAMGKIESMAVAHFNKRNALTWAEYKTLFPVPVAYQAASTVGNPITEEDDRAVSQVHGPGHMRVMAEKDRLEYFAPDPTPFQVAREDLDNLRDEMHRVLHHMALSVDNSGAALQRSADSKAIDQAAAAVVLKALGGYVREHFVAIMGLVQRGRGDAETNWSAHGMDAFDDATAAQLVEEAMTLETVRVPSATFQVKHKLALAKKVLGANATDEDLEVIQDELETAITQDSFDTAAQAEVAANEAKAETPPGSPADLAARAKAMGKAMGKGGKVRPEEA